jgi:hypothetical protein
MDNTLDGSLVDFICPDYIERGDESLNIQERRTAMMSEKILVSGNPRSEGG